jgi:hypothetical protein
MFHRPRQSGRSSNFTTPKPLASSPATLNLPSRVEQIPIYEHVRHRCIGGFWHLYLPLHFPPYVTLSPKHIFTSTSDLQLQVPNQTEGSNTTTHNECLKRKHTQPTCPTPSQQETPTDTEPSGHESRFPIRLHLNGPSRRHRHRLLSQQLHLNQISFAQWSRQRRQRHVQILRRRRRGWVAWDGAVGGFL